MECDVCGGKDLLKTGELRKGIPKGATMLFDVYRCQNCGSEMALLVHVLDKEVYHEAN